MSKALLYAVNNTSQTVAVGGTINFGSVIRRYGCNCNLSGGNPIIEGIGYYNVDSNFTFEPSGAGTVAISFYKDGILIPGATISLTTVADTIYSVSIPFIVRQNCCMTSTITAVVSGVGANVTNASVEIVKG